MLRAMATSGTIIERFAQASGDLPSTVDRMLRPLRAAGLAPFGERGRGQRQGHYDVSHLANVLMAFGGAQPADAAEAVSLFRNLPHCFSAGVPPHDSGRPYPKEGLNFGAGLEQVIQSVASDWEKVLRLLPQDLAHPYGPWPDQIRLTLRMPTAEVMWLSATGPIERKDFYSSAESMKSTPISGVQFDHGVTRSTQIDGKMVILAAELLRSHPSWRPSQTLLPPSASAVPNADQKDESAESVPTLPAPTRGRQHARRSPAHSSQPATARETRATVEASQPTFASRPLTFLDFEKSESLSS